MGVSSGGVQRFEFCRLSSGDQSGISRGHIIAGRGPHGTPAIRAAVVEVLSRYENSFASACPEVEALCAESVDAGVCSRSRPCWSTLR